MGYYATSRPKIQVFLLFVQENLKKIQEFMMGGHSMSEMNSTRNGCRDVFHAFLVKNATYDSNLEIPCLAREVQKPGV